MTTPFQVEITQKIVRHSDIHQLYQTLDTHLGGIFLSNYEVPNRYSLWSIGFSDPPLQLEAWGHRFRLTAFTPTGDWLLEYIRQRIHEVTWLEKTNTSSHCKIPYYEGTIVRQTTLYNGVEQERTRRPSIMSLVRWLRDILTPEDPDDFLGWYGAFGYALVYQFEDIDPPSTQEDNRDVVLYFPDSLLIQDKVKGTLERRTYHFGIPTERTDGPVVMGSNVTTPTHTAIHGDAKPCDPLSGGYAKTVQELLPRFQQGNLFECVLSQEWTRPCSRPASSLFKELLTANPSPYSFLLNLGNGEHLVGASPEMFVRVRGNRVESCPISGTIRRGRDAFEDAQQVHALLNSEKDETELVMCTDVDRNDKARICHPGSVRVLSHREIETYSRLFHTVDHVEGYLRPEFDGLDALLTHLWAVTVTGAPKAEAIAYIRDHEPIPRQWYAGAVGMIHMNGDVNTGMTLRTIHLKRGVAHVRAGATLLYDSDPVAEEVETQLKASALLGILDVSPAPEKAILSSPPLQTNPIVLMIDFCDSFVHTIASYFAEMGAEVETVRYYNLPKTLVFTQYQLVILSPGPGHPRDYPMQSIIDALIRDQTPVFGICLGFQAILSHFGANLGVLSQPHHGVAGEIEVIHPSRIFPEKIGDQLRVGLYHSLYVGVDQVPQPFRVTATQRQNNGNGNIAMAVEHPTLPLYGIQFHMESVRSHREGARSIIRSILTRGSHAGFPRGVPTERTVGSSVMGAT